MLPPYKLILRLLVTSTLGISFWWYTGFTVLASPPEPDSDPDAMIPEIFQEPILSENPSQVEQGAYDYFYHCMPCHGDHGQGLTDEFRGMWVPDHQNCWAAGCHSGRPDEEGFPIPRDIPGVLNLDHFSTPESLFIYLKATHPPQYPGGLEAEQYWSVTAHLLNLSGRLPPDGQVGEETLVTEIPSSEVPMDNPPTSDNPEYHQEFAWSGLVWFVAAILLVSLALIRQTR